MALSTYIIGAFYLSALSVYAHAAASCDINCVTCDTNGTCAECGGGYYNNLGICYPCRGNCMSCKDAYFCTVCDDGFYTFESSLYTSCLKCLPNCVKCNSTAFCSECTPGHYGKRCDESCNSCKDGACSKTDCTHGCIDGYFQFYFHDIYSYCSKCLSNCKSCTNSSHCNTCHDGYYLINYAAGNICNQCNLNCKSCSLSSFCDSCPSGRWDSTCESHCPVGCKNSRCDIYTGLCNEECTEGYYMKYDGDCYPCLQSSSDCHCPDFQYYNGNMCVPCIYGYWGRLCNESCNSNCFGRKCQNATGHCNNCNQTYYGRFCEYNCNNKCINPSNGSSVCDNTGRCLFGYHDGLVGPLCHTLEFTTSKTTIQQTPSSATRVDKALTTTVSTFGQTDANPQAGVENTVPVGTIAGAVGGAVFIILITGAVFAFIFMKRRNDPSKTDTAYASRADAPYENTPGTNVGGMSTYADLCHVSGEETPYSTVTRTEYENVNV